MTSKSLAAFLQPKQVQNKEVVISDRFLGEDGKPVPFEIRPILTDEAQELMKQNMKPKKDGTQDFDSASYQADLIIAATVFPDFKSAELQKAYGVLGERELLMHMLLIGEYTQLRNKVFALSGIYDDINAKIEEAKN